MTRGWRVFAGLSGFVAVLIGAVGAHMVADAARAALVEKAALYELVFAALILWLSDRDSKGDKAGRLLFALGTLLFCGTIYLKVFAGYAHATALAPAGGICFMLGWFAIAFL